MTINHEWRKYPANKPPIDDHYLVSVNPAFILKLGLAPCPSVLISRYKPDTQEWQLVSQLPYPGSIGDEVIAWCELPKPSE